MDREPDGVDDASSRAPGTTGARRLVAAGVAGGVLLLVIAVLATRLASLPSTPASAASRAASGSPSPSPAASLTASAIYRRVVQSVVTVRGHDLGTGVIVADSGIVLTAAHVVSGAQHITVTFADGTVASASVASANKTTDIALLIPAKLPRVVVPATLGGVTAVGNAVVAVGNPFGLTDSVSSGVVSGLNRSADTNTGKRTGLIQFDASVNPGSSGGPLIDDRGKVIGIVVAIADPGGRDAFAGIGFAVPISAALGSGSGRNGSGKGPQI